LLRHFPWAADLLVKQAHVFARQGQSQQAALSLTRALLLNPRVAFADPGFASRGDRAARAGNWPRAVAIFRIMAEQPGSSPLLRSNLLLAELAAGDAEAARRTAGAIVAALPDQGDAGVAAGLPSWLSAAPLSEADAAKWEQHARQAVVRQRNALTLQFHGIALYRAGKHEEAARVLAESVKASGGDGPAETWLFQALAAQKQGQRAEALGLLARYEIWHRQQTFPDWRERARHEALRAEAQREVDPDLWNKRGTACAVQGRWQQAAADFARAFELQLPEDPLLWQAHAILRLQVGDAKGYQQICTRMVERFGQNNANEFVRLLPAICVLAPNALDDAARVLELAKRREAKDNPSFYVYHVLGLAYYRVGQYEKAVAAFDKGLPLDPANKLSVLNWLPLAMAHHRLGHADQARQSLDKAKRWIDQTLRQTPPAAGEFAPPGWSWFDWLKVQFLRREAEALLAGKEAEPEK